MGTSYYKMNLFKYVDILHLNTIGTCWPGKASTALGRIPLALRDGACIAASASSKAAPVVPFNSHLSLAFNMCSILGSSCTELEHHQQCEWYVFLVNSHL